VHRALSLTCLGLVDSPGEEASLGNRLCGLVVRLTAETAEEWPLVQSYEQERDESWAVSISSSKPMEYQAFESMPVGNRAEWTSLFLS
jgi:hypothetical protein